MTLEQIAKAIADEIDAFDKQCAETEYTDTGQVWELLHDWRKRLRESTKPTWDHSNPHPIDIVCGECGSRNVMRDAWAVWNTETQRWELGNVFDDGHCEDCEGEASLEEIPLDESEAANAD